MEWRVLMFLVPALAFGAAYAQNGALAGVTMRVLDDISDLDAVILELDASSGEGEQAAEANREADAASANDADDAADRRDPAAQEDRDVERPAVPPTAVP